MKLIVKEALPPVIDVVVGALGTVEGVAITGTESALYPSLSPDSNVTVYSVPFVNPLIIKGLVILPSSV